MDSGKSVVTVGAYKSSSSKPQKKKKIPEDLTKENHNPPRSEHVADKQTQGQSKARGKGQPERIVPEMLKKKRRNRSVGWNMLL